MSTRPRSISPRTVVASTSPLALNSAGRRQGPIPPPRPPRPPSAVLPPPTIFDCTEIIPPPAEFTEFKDADETIIPPPSHFQEDPTSLQAPDVKSESEGRTVINSLAAEGAGNTAEPALMTPLMVTSSECSPSNSKVGIRSKEDEVLTLEQKLNSLITGEMRSSSSSSSLRTAMETNLHSDKVSSTRSELSKRPQHRLASRIPIDSVRKCVSEEVINNSNSRVVMKSLSETIGKKLESMDKRRSDIDSGGANETTREHRSGSSLERCREEIIVESEDAKNTITNISTTSPLGTVEISTSDTCTSETTSETSTVSENVFISTSETSAASEIINVNNSIPVAVTNDSDAKYTTEADVSSKKQSHTIPVTCSTVQPDSEMLNNKVINPAVVTDVSDNKSQSTGATSSRATSRPTSSASSDDVMMISDEDIMKSKYGAARTTPRQLYFKDFGGAVPLHGGNDVTRRRTDRVAVSPEPLHCRRLDDEFADLNFELEMLRKVRPRSDESNYGRSFSPLASSPSPTSASMNQKSGEPQQNDGSADCRPRSVDSAGIRFTTSDSGHKVFTVASPESSHTGTTFGTCGTSGGRRGETASFFAEFRKERARTAAAAERRRRDIEMALAVQRSRHPQSFTDTREIKRSYPIEVHHITGARDDSMKQSERKEEVIEIARPLSFILPERPRLVRHRSQDSSSLMRPFELSTSFETTSSSINTSAPVSPILHSRPPDDSSGVGESEGQPVGSSSFRMMDSSSEYLSSHSRQSSNGSCLSLSPTPTGGSASAGAGASGQSHFVVVAIDFGTTYSGYAFSFTRDPESIHMMRRWEGGDPGIVNQKTPTTLLLHPDGTFYSFGFTARDFYHDLDAQESKKWLYFEKFKMALHHNADLTKDTMIKASNGKPYPALTVFSHALKFFKDHALQELSDQSSTTIINEDIRWVITVPAIWKAPAKQFMRQAAYQAGIASSDSPGQLLIALEPEAASIYVRKLRLYQLVPDTTGISCSRYQMSQTGFRSRREQTPDTSLGYTGEQFSEGNLDDSIKYQTLPAGGGGGSEHFNESLYPTSTSATVGHQVDKAGTRYMVVDCGGGTVDITVYEMESKYGQLKELHKATGGPFGSLGVDMEFERLLIAIFGVDFITTFKTKRPAGWVDLMTAFESRKRTASPYKSNSLNVSLPFSFIDYYKKCKGSQVEGAIRKYGNKDICWSSQGMLRLTTDAMRRLFQPTLDHIKQAIGDVLNCPNARDIQFLFLVGGFSESPILQLEIRREFGHLLRIIIPQDVGLTILKGAVCFGLDPTVVSVRRSRLTYGVGVLNRFVHGKHPPSKLVTKQAVDWCTDIFDKYVEVDQSVALGDIVIRSYTPAKVGQKSSIIHIYCTDKPNVEYITEPGVKRCGTLCLDLTDLQYRLPTVTAEGKSNGQEGAHSLVGKRREIHTQMTFGDTEIKVTALDVSTGKCVRAAIDFLNK